MSFGQKERERDNIDKHHDDKRSKLKRPVEWDSSFLGEYYKHDKKRNIYIERECERKKTDGQTPLTVSLFYRPSLSLRCAHRRESCGCWEITSMTPLQSLFLFQGHHHHLIWYNRQERSDRVRKSPACLSISIDFFYPLESGEQTVRDFLKCSPSV